MFRELRQPARSPRLLYIIVAYYRFIVMISLLVDANFPGPPHRIRFVAKELKRYDYESERDFVGCDIAPLPDDLLELLNDTERQWFHKFIRSLQAGVSSRPAVHMVSRSHTAEQFNALKASLNCLRVRRSVEKEVRDEALRTLADVGIRSWQDLLGLDDGILAGRRLTSAARTLCVELIDAANEQAARANCPSVRPAKLQRTNSVSQSCIPAAPPCPFLILSKAESPGARVNLCVGPSSACKQLAVSCSTTVERRAWLEGARVTAILGSSPHSLSSIRSGLRCWYSFAQCVLQKHRSELPPSTNDLLAWSTLFRCGATFSNYLNYVRIGCHLVGVSSEATTDPQMKRAKIAIDKRRNFVQRERRFIQHQLVRRILRSAYENDDELFGMLVLTTYVFLLRLPSECLPIWVGSSGRPDGCQAAITVKDEAIVLNLKRRKNLQGGSQLHRQCWCKECVETCPVHSLGAFFSKLKEGTQPFAQFTPGSALLRLRSYLSALGIDKANSYRTHDIRRGHAKDLQERGAGLMEILRAGQWRSPAFLSYLDLEELERDAVIEAHVAESSDSGSSSDS